MKLKDSLEYSDKTSCFELKLFSSTSRKFSVTFTARSRYLGGPTNLLLCVGKKVWSYDTPIRLYCKNVSGWGNHAFSPHVQYTRSFARHVISYFFFQMFLWEFNNIQAAFTDKSRSDVFILGWIWPKLERGWFNTIDWKRLWFLCFNASHDLYDHLQWHWRVWTSPLEHNCRVARPHFVRCFLSNFSSNQAQHVQLFRKSWCKTLSSNC